MKLVDSPSKRLYKSLIFIFGTPFFLIGLVFYFVDGSWAFLLNGLLWILAGIGLKIKSVYNTYKLQELKANGIKYEGQITEIMPYPWIKIGSYVTARLKCTYKSGEQDCMVTSGYCLLLPIDRLEDLKAIIYFDRNCSSKFVVELLRFYSK